MFLNIKSWWIYFVNRISWRLHFSCIYHYHCVAHFWTKISDYASFSKKPSHSFRRLTGQFFLCVDGVKKFHSLTIPIFLVFGIFKSGSAMIVKYKFDSRRIQKFQNIVHLVSKWPKILRQSTHLQWMLVMDWVPVNLIFGYPKDGFKASKNMAFLHFCPNIWYNLSKFRYAFWQII